MDIVVTGASGALGSGVVAALVARGVTVHAPMVEDQPAPHLVHANVRTTPGIKLDDEAAVTRFYDALPGLWASIHLVGGFGMAPIEKLTLADFEKQWRTNAVTCFLSCREAVKAIRRSGAGGRIVNVAARPVLVPTPGMLAYVAAKASVAAMTQALAAEVLAENILVNAVLPSTIDSPANRASMPKADHARWPTPAQLAETIVFLASKDNAVTSGALIPVYGRA